MYRRYGSRTTQEQLSRSNCRGAVALSRERKLDGSKDFYPLNLLNSANYSGRSGKHWGFERAFVVSELPLRDGIDLPH